MNFLTGETLNFKENIGTVTINWRQKFLQRRQHYSDCRYTTPGGTIIPVYIQSDYSVPKKLTIDDSLQYGQQDGMLFFVSHNKEQKPYQHRFMKSEFEKHIYALRDIFRLDVTQIIGKYLYDVKCTETVKTSLNPDFPSQSISGNNIGNEGCRVTRRTTGLSGGSAEKSNVFGEAQNVTINQHYYSTDQPE